MNRNVEWAEFIALLKGTDVPADFLSTEERDQGACGRDPFEGWEEPADHSGDESAPRASA
jgi:hypothetical protein